MFDSKKWNLIDYDKEITNKLIDEIGISRVCSILLCNRGFTDTNSAKVFLEKNNSSLYNPFKLNDMQIAVERIITAIKENEVITIYGDYDVDGITSTSILYQYLKNYTPHVNYYIPSRENDGYGVNIEAIKRIKERGTSLIITVDTGTTAIEEVDYSKKLGIDFVITDHHEVLDNLPNAIAVVNPCKKDNTYPFSNLAGVGVAFKLICAIELAVNNNYQYDINLIKKLSIKYLDLVAIGTVGDVVPLIDENRLFVYLGLKLLKSTENIGIKTLLSDLGLNNKELKSTTISYNIAPKINACGRMGKEQLGVELLTTKDEKYALELAYNIINLNKMRQNIEDKIVKEAIEIIENQKLYNDPIIVVYNDDWNVGVIGIVASRVLDLYNKPVIIISFVDGDVFGKGSSRSTNNINIHEILSKSSDLLEKYGGHEGAAGLTIKRDNIELFKNRIFEISKKIENNSCKNINVDCELYPYELSIDVVNSFKNMEPFGMGNEVPTFLIKNAVIIDLFLISGGKHTKIKVDYGDYIFECIMFSHNLDDYGFKIGDHVDLIFNLESETFNKKEKVNIIIRDIDYSYEIKNKIEKFQNILNEVLSGKQNINKDIVPTREDLIEIYLNLKSVVGENNKIISIKKLLSNLNIDNYLRTGIALIAMNEMDIINIVKISKIEFEVSITNINKKTNIFDAPIFKKLMVE